MNATFVAGGRNSECRVDTPRSLGALLFRRLLGCTADAGQDGLHECRLALDVALSISRELSSQGPLQLRVLALGLRIRPQDVSKGEVLSPERPALLHEVNVIGPRLSAPKELMPGNPTIAAMLVPSPSEGGNIARRRCVGRVAGENVEDRLGAEARNGCAADVLEYNGKRPARLAQALRLGGEEAGPPLIVLHHADFAGLKAEWRTHPCCQKAVRRGFNGGAVWRFAGSDRAPPAPRRSARPVDR